MKFHLFTFFLFFSVFIFAQKNDSLRNATETYLSKLFSKLPASKFKDLVPFYDNEKWGYLDRNSKKIIIPTVFSYPFFFNPDSRIYFNGEMVNISGSGVVTLESENENRIFVEENKGPDIDTKVKSSANGFKGFTVSSTGELVAYSDLYWYNRQGIPGWNIQLFKYQDRYYGIVTNLQGQAGIIDSSGTPLKGFEFNFHEIIPNRNTADSVNVWFFVKKNKSENFSLINTKGEVKFENEIFSYPLLSSEVFGYTLYQKGDTSAIFDRFLMKWVIKPQTKTKVEGIYFSADKYLSIDVAQNRKQAFIYYLVREKNRPYFADINGNKYLPK